LKINTSYKQILSISVPIMLGSAAQNVIVLTDNVFLYHRSALEFASIGLIGVFYLIIAATGYGFSRGGQIIIARRYGEYNKREVGASFLSLAYMEVIVALLIFLFIQFLSRPFFSYFISNPEILELCLDYIYPRSYGIFFSFLGVAFIGLYTGIAKTQFIIYDTLLLVVVNLILNYTLIFGKFGFPEMGIVGAAWASTIAEIVAFVVFVIYMWFDRSFKKFEILKQLRPNWNAIWNTFSVSFPIVIQAIIGIGSWFVLFTMIENMGERELAQSNLIRNVYLILSIPCWGFSAAINTIVSNFIGQQKRHAVIPMIHKTAFLSGMVTLLFTLPAVLFPEYILYPLFGSEDMSLIKESQSLFYLLFFIIMTFSTGAIYYNGFLGTGATMMSLLVQAISVLFYVVFIYFIINVYDWGLVWAWSVEIFYWILLAITCFILLKTKYWYSLKI